MNTAVGGDLDQIQGNIAPGFRTDFEDFLFLRFPTGAAGRQWLGQLFHEVTSAREVANFAQLRDHLRHPPELRSGPTGAPPPGRASREVSRFARVTWVNVALTAHGLETILEVHDLKARRFPDWFTAGMSNRDIQTGDDARRIPDWEVRDSLRPGEADQDREKLSHALLLLGADSERDLDAELRRQLDRLSTLGFTLICRYRGHTLGGAREHFGFHDGISQPDPTTAELLRGWKKSARAVAPGEFILGQPDENGSTRLEGPAWARNGSYLVFRQLEQDVDLFRRSVRNKAAELRKEGVDDMTTDQLAAKLVGRWPSGAKLLRPAGGQPVEKVDRFRGVEPGMDRLTVRDEDFAEDKVGDGCPLFSHIRKAHPRTIARNSDPNPDRHRIIRRGISYGPPLPDGAKDDGLHRGLLFVGYQANIERQFETIQGQWLSSGSSPEAGSTPGWDPLVGSNRYHPDELRGLYFHRPGGVAQDVLLGFERFVTVRGGGYFFAPSIAALAFLSGEDGGAPD